MNAIQILFTGLILWGLWRSEVLLAHLFFASIAFGALALVPPTWMGGFNVVAPAATALALTARLLCAPGVLAEVQRGMFKLDALGCLTLYLITAAVVTFFMPRLFRGVAVIPMALTAGELRTVPLAPSGQNISQMAYLLMSSAMVFVTYGVFKTRNFFPLIYRGMLTGAVVTLLTGWLDMAVPSGVLAPVRELFRTASYAYLPDGEIAPGARRIVGFLTEASAYGGACTTFAAFLLLVRPSEEHLRRWALLLGAACFVMALVSTSSAAYVTVAALAVVLALVMGWRAAYTPKHLFISTSAVWFGTAVAVGVAVFGLLHPEKLDAIGTLLNRVVFEKGQSSSYDGRMGWNIHGIEALMQTQGLGVGIGSLRTSNFYLNIVCSTGVIGFGFFMAFLWQVFSATRRLSINEPRIDMLGIKLSLLVGSVSGMLAGTTPDFGPFAGIVFGILLGLKNNNPVIACNQKYLQALSP